MSIGVWQLLLILVIVFVLFGAGKLPKVMSDVGKGIHNLRDGLKGEGDKKNITEAKTSDENDSSKRS